MEIGYGMGIGDCDLVLVIGDFNKEFGLGIEARNSIEIGIEIENYIWA